MCFYLIIYRRISKHYEVNPQRDYGFLPQNLVSAMAASVPLTAVQITDADLLKIEENIIELNNSS